MGCFFTKSTECIYKLILNKTTFGWPIRLFQINIPTISQLVWTIIPHHQPIWKIASQLAWQVLLLLSLPPQTVPTPLPSSIVVGLLLSFTMAELPHSPYVLLLYDSTPFMFCSIAALPSYTVLWLHSPHILLHSHTPLIYCCMTPLPSHIVA